MNALLFNPSINWAALRCIAFGCALFAAVYVVGKFK